MVVRTQWDAKTIRESGYVHNSVDILLARHALRGFLVEQYKRANDVVIRR